MTTAHSIGVAIDAIPDNIRLDGNRTLACISVSLTPNTKPKPGDIELADLSQWPTLIAKGTKNLLRVAVGKLAGSTGYSVSNFRVLDDQFGQDAVLQCRATVGRSPGTL